MQKMAIWGPIVVFVACIGLSGGISISSFDQLPSAGSLKDAWNQQDPGLIEYGFSAVFGGGKIFAVGQRFVRSDADKPKAGGIVSVLDIGQGKWISHQKNTLDLGMSNFTIFALDSRLHMLVYTKGNASVQFPDAMYAWDEKSGTWTSVPLAISANYKTVTGNRPPIVRVSVPDQAGSLAYVTVSSSLMQHNSATLYKLEITAQNGATTNANMTYIMPILEPVVNLSKALKEVVFVASDKIGSPLAFARQDYQTSDGNSYWRVHLMFNVSDSERVSYYHYIDNGPVLPSEDRNDRVFQVGTRVLFVGMALFGRGGTVPDIAAYDYTTSLLQDARASIPDGAYAIDQATVKLYAVEWDKVSAATVTFDK